MAGARNVLARRGLACAICVGMVACGRAGFDNLRGDAGDAGLTDEAPDVPDAAPLHGVYLAIVGITAATSSVRFFAPTASGTSSPLRTITGPTSGIDGPLGLYVDVARSELYIANFFTPPSVRVFALDADGDPAPLRTLDRTAGSKLDEPRRAFIDQAHDEMIVTDFDDAVRTYPRLASGATAPVRELQGAATLINNPLETALDPVNDELYTTTANIDGANHAGILVFDRTATGNVAPKRTIAGTNTHLDPSTGVWVALDLVNRELYVSADNGAGIAVFDMTANGNVAPKREIIGAATTLDHASTMLVDNTSDRLDVVLTNRVVVFPRTTSGNVAPVQELTVSDATSLWGFATDGSTGLTGP